ncbi:response regulator [Ideonella sp.]|uniref:response regulator n=1 Tax=Ideonella sp. TaxID=1929293 RepID=UPI0035B32C12
MNASRKRTILAVDDDQKTRQLLKLYLEKHQYVVQLAADGASFRSGFERYRDELSLVILDVMLPDTDGFALCQLVRQRAPTLPIIMLTASADDTERIVGLELGADDYIGKPYNPRELLARIKAIHRRAGMGGEGAPRYLSFAGFKLDRLERTLAAPDGEKVTLTAMDFDLLRLFAEHSGEVLDRARLMEQTRGRDLGPTDRSLDVQVSRLRQRLGDDGKQPALIKTVRSSGYVFSVEVQASHD